MTGPADTFCLPCAVPAGLIAWSIVGVAMAESWSDRGIRAVALKRARVLLGSRRLSNERPVAGSQIPRRPRSINPQAAPASESKPTFRHGTSRAQRPGQDLVPSVSSFSDSWRLRVGYRAVRSADRRLDRSGLVRGAPRGRRRLQCAALPIQSRGMLAVLPGPASLASRAEAGVRGGPAMPQRPPPQTDTRRADRLLRM